MILAFVRLRKHVSERTIVYKIRPQPKLKEIWTKAKNIKGFFSKLVYLYGARKNRNVRGDWNDNNKIARRWAFIIASYTGFVWMFAIYMLFRKTVLALILNLFDGRDNAIAVLTLQAVDTVAIIWYRPFSESGLLMNETVGGVTNLLAFINICTPVIGGPGMAWPDWMSDNFTMMTGLFATALSAVTALSETLMVIFGALSGPLKTMMGDNFFEGFCSCLTGLSRVKIKIASAPECEIPDEAPPTDDMVDVAVENTQGELDAQTADKVVGYDENDPFEKGSDEEEVSQGGVGAGAATMTITAEAAAAAVHHYYSRGYRLHAIITMILKIDYTSVGEEISNERAIFNNDLTGDLSAASTGLPPECFQVGKVEILSSAIPPSEDSSTIATSVGVKTDAHLHKPTRVKMSIEAKGLASMDWTSKSDPMAVLFAVGDDGKETLIGNTEWHKNKTDVKFETQIDAEYFLERKQKLIFRVMDVDDPHDPLNGAQEIGHVQVTMSKVRRKIHFEIGHVEAPVSKVRHKINFAHTKFSGNVHEIELN
jgi:hypothetical protein